MIRVETIQTISLQDFDELVSDTYGRPYSFQQQDGCKERQHVDISVPTPYSEDYDNDTIFEETNAHVTGVSFKAWLARDPEQRLGCDNGDAGWMIELWWNRSFYPCVDMVINDLYSKGLLDAGDYVINIDW
jgi:hypothetical protein